MGSSHKKGQKRTKKNMNKNNVKIKIFIMLIFLVRKYSLIAKIKYSIGTKRPITLKLVSAATDKENKIELLKFFFINKLMP